MNRDTYTIFTTGGGGDLNWEDKISEGMVDMVIIQGMGDIIPVMAIIMGTVVIILDMAIIMDMAVITLDMAIIMGMAVIILAMVTIMGVNDRLKRSIPVIQQKSCLDLCKTFSPITPGTKLYHTTLSILS